MSVEYIPLPDLPAPRTKRLAGLAGALLLVACQGPARVDVLEEFPPPRPAHDSARVAPIHTTAAVTAGELSLVWVTRTDKLETHVRRAAGSFDYTAGQWSDLKGEVVIRLTDGDLPAPLLDSLTARGASAAVLTWRVLEVLGVEVTRAERQQVGPAKRTTLSVLSELEFNGVRTRHVQTIELSTPCTEDKAQLMQLEWPGNVRPDLSAHRLSGPQFTPSPGVLARVEIGLRVQLQPVEQKTVDVARATSWSFSQLATE